MAVINKNLGNFEVLDISYHPINGTSHVMCMCLECKRTVEIEVKDIKEVRKSRCKWCDNKRKEYSSSNNDTDVNRKENNKNNDNREMNRLRSVWRGIKDGYIVEEWKTYEEFEKWSLKNGYKDWKTIAKINDDEAYGPDNCVWIVDCRGKNNSIIINRNSTRVENRNALKAISYRSEQMLLEATRLYIGLESLFDSDFIKDKSVIIDTCEDMKQVIEFMKAVIKNFDNIEY